MNYKELYNYAYEFLLSKESTSDKLIKKTLSFRVSKTSKYKYYIINNFVLPLKTDKWVVK